MAALADPSEPPPHQDISFAITQIPQLVTFLRRTGLGFCSVPRDRLADPEDDEVDDLDIGPIGSLGLDLDF